MTDKDKIQAVMDFAKAVDVFCSYHDGQCEYTSYPDDCEENTCPFWVNERGKDYGINDCILDNIRFMQYGSIAKKVFLALAEFEKESVEE